MSLIRRTLVKLGFFVLRDNATFSLCYTKNYQTKLGTFLIRLNVLDESLVRLPRASVVTLPEDLEGVALPHIFFGSLCYIDSELINWNPNNPEQVLTWVDSWIETTLDRVADKSLWITEYAGEFANYWGGNKAYILSKNKKSTYQSYACEIGLRKEKINEYVICDDVETSDKWKELRNGNCYSKEAPVLFIKVKHLSIPQGVQWPPLSFKAFTVFLKNTDHASLSYLLQGISTKLTQHVNSKKVMNNTVNLLVVCDTTDGYFGFELKYSNKTKALFQNLSKNRKMATLLPFLTSKKSLVKFQHLDCSDTTEEFLVGRNKVKETDLRNKRVALIGAGTIGGYTAHSLVQSGAGGGKGVFDLYDSDTLESHNLGRHLLGAKFLGWNKTEALVYELLTRSPHQASINSVSDNFTQHHLKNRYDIIIDATGAEPFSLALRAWIGQLKPNQKRPDLIHGWIDGYGQAARVIIDDGRICYSCLGNFNSEERFPVFKKDKKPPIKQHSRKCGTTFTPYDSAISTICAGLIQSATTRILNGEKWNFAQHGMNMDINHLDMKILKRFKKCKLCNEK